MDSSGQGTKHSEEDEERFARLFEQLDHNKDGKLDLQELREGIERLGLPSESGTAQVCLCLAGLPVADLLSGLKLESSAVLIMLGH